MVKSSAVGWPSVVLFRQTVEEDVEARMRTRQCVKGRRRKRWRRELQKEGKRKRKSRGKRRDTLYEDELLRQNLNVHLPASRFLTKSLRNTELVVSTKVLAPTGHRQGSRVRGRRRRERAPEGRIATENMAGKCSDKASGLAASEVCERPGSPHPRQNNLVFCQS